MNPPPRPSRLKRILLALLVVEILTSPILLMMDDGPPKIIVAGVWFGVFCLTLLGVFIIGITTSIDKR